jgi:hypothetical protein
LVLFSCGVRDVFAGAVMPFAVVEAGSETLGGGTNIHLRDCFSQQSRVWKLFKAFRLSQDSV